MLYDNALLAQAYLEAYKVLDSLVLGAMEVFTHRITAQVTSDPTYASIASETLDYVRRVMENRDLGGFYSAEDADSEGVEGKFYVWTKSEIDSILTPEVLPTQRDSRLKANATSTSATGTQEAARFCEVYSVTERGNFEHRTNHLNLLRQNVLLSLLLHCFFYCTL